MNYRPNNSDKEGVYVFKSGKKHERSRYPSLFISVNLKNKYTNLIYQIYTL